MNIRVEIATARDGNEILEITVNEQKYNMNSTYRPLVEAERFAQQYEKLENDAVLIVFGFGNGIFPKALVDMCPSDTKIIFMEPGKEIMECVAERYSVWDFCKQHQNYLVSQEIPAEEGESFFVITDFPKVLEKVIQYHNLKRVHYCALPKYKELFPEEYKIFEESIHYRVRILQSNAFTAKHIGHTAVRNNIKNLKYIPDSYCGDSFIHVFPEKLPAVIVSAGPSLERNIHILHKAKGRALILCVDTALKYLLKENIFPDLIVSVDPRKSLSLLEDDRRKGIPLVGCSDMSFRVLEWMQGSKTIFASTENPYIQSIYQLSGHQIKRIESAGSVTTMAYSLCCYWGFTRLILVGQDLALTGNQMYAGEKKFLKEEFGRELLEIEDIYGEKIYTTRDYYYYLKWFEQTISMNSNVEVIDATEGGARIAGTQIMSLKDALETYAQKEHNITEIIESVKPAFDSRQKEQIAERIQKSNTTLSILLDRLKQGISLAEDGMNITTIGTRGNENQCLHIDRQIQEICQYYDALEEGFLIQREIDATELEKFMALFEEKKGITKTEQYERIKTYFGCLLRATKTVAELLSELKEGDELGK